MSTRHLDRLDPRKRKIVMLHAVGLTRGAAVVAPLAVATAMIPLRTSVSNATGALVMVVVIVGVSALGDRVAGLLAAVSAGVWFDFFLTLPYERLTISHREDIETTVLLFCVGLAVTELTVRGRRQRTLARERSAHLDELLTVARMMAEGADAEVALSRVQATLSGLLELRGCRYEPLPPTGRTAVMRTDGSVAWAGLSWAYLPGREVDLPISYLGHSYGRFVLSPTPGVGVPLERRLVACVLADEVGAMLAGVTEVTLLNHSGGI